MPSSFKFWQEIYSTLLNPNDKRTTTCFKITACEMAYQAKFGSLFHICPCQNLRKSEHTEVWYTCCAKNWREVLIRSTIDFLSDFFRVWSGERRHISAIPEANQAQATVPRSLYMRQHVSWSTLCIVTKCPRLCNVIYTEEISTWCGEGGGVVS